MNVEEQKRAAAGAAARLVEDGMVVGLGSGTTAEAAIEVLGERVRDGLKFEGVPTSEQSAALARSLGIPLVLLDDNPQLDLAIDGADEVDPGLNCVKGHGGQLLREKIVATAARHFVVIVDETKLVSGLGSRADIPVEITPFGWTTTRRRVEDLGFRSALRGGNEPFLTAGSNYILDCRPLHPIDLRDPAVGASVKSLVGVVEHGIFLLAGGRRTILVGRVDGTVETLSGQAE